MTTTVSHSREDYLAEHYDPDDVGPRDSPLLQPIRPKLAPSPSPPPMVPLPEISPTCSPDPSGRKGSSRSRNRPSLGDAVLVHFMDGGKHLDISRKAGDEPLASDNEDGDESVKGGVDVDLSTEREDMEKESPEREGDDAEQNEQRTETMPSTKEKGDTDQNIDAAEEDPLAALALNALRHIARNPAQIEGYTNGIVREPPAQSLGDAMEGVKATPLPSIMVDNLNRQPSTTENSVKLEILPNEELPPIRQTSPQSGLSNGSTGGPITLPSITNLTDQLPDAHTPRDIPAFSQSPPGAPPRFNPVQGHGSPPPKSPNDFRALPSPGRGGFYAYNNQHRNDGPQYSSAGDYSSSTETPSTDHSASTPAMGIDRMSIDNMTNPQIGGFQCTYPGCNAQPFQTQYLLNSHANVHSQNRPHYCSVKGCPRSEGGKGFKRKNEMIRHGLVHDSPGYVCPFCPDREHKYPRPDNLQRHVRVHHEDKDKDDPQLREVLSQRPEGPSRGRRRRGGTS